MWYSNLIIVIYNLKVALIADGIHPYVIGGMQKHSFYLAKYFSLNGVKVDLYHTSFRNKVSTAIEQLDCFTDKEKESINSILVEFPKHTSLPGHYLRESYEYSCKVFEKFKKSGNVDFIYAKGFTAWKLIEEKQKGDKCPPIGVNFHGYEMFQRAPSIKSELEQKLFLRKPVLFNIRHADYVFSYGGKITNVIKDLNIQSNKIIEVSTAIEPSWLVNTIKPTIGKRRFIFIGRYEERKGIKELTEAITQFKVGVFEFHFVGDIPHDKKIIRPDFIYHGLINDEHVIKQLMRLSDVLVCPSYSEGMPNVILEGMANGLAIIATDVGAVGLMVSKNNGWLLDFPSVNNISRSLQQAIDCEDRLLDIMKRKSLDIVQEKYLWNNVVVELIAEIKKCIVKEKRRFV